MPPESTTPPRRICSIDWCEKPVAAKGWCQMHYARNRDGKDMQARPKGGLVGIAPCGVAGCDGKYYADNLCKRHYFRRRYRLKKGIPLDKPLKGSIKVCTVVGCEMPYAIDGLCSMHYGRRRSSGHIGPAGRLHAPKGSGTINADGYRRITVDGRPVLEHRRAMEAVLGRPLRSFETVHHKNGVRHDNRPDNLELWASDHRSGQRVEDLIAFVIKHYPEAARAALEGKPQESWLAPRAVD